MVRLVSTSTRAAVVVAAEAAAWAEPLAASPRAALPKSAVAEQAIPAFETCFKNRRRAEENRFIDTGQLPDLLQMGSPCGKSISGKRFPTRRTPLITGRVGTCQEVFAGRDGWIWNQVPRSCLEKC